MSAGETILVVALVLAALLQKAALDAVRWRIRHLEDTQAWMMRSSALDREIGIISLSLRERAR